jgi:hypothetical protein
VTVPDQEALAKVLAPHYEGPLAHSRITPAHLAQISDAFCALRSDPQTQAFLLLCLASVFARLSSSHFFGTHAESPHALRQYSASLLATACDLDPALVPPSVAGYWQNELLASAAQAYTCTAIVSNLMLSHIKTRAAGAPALNEIYAVTWPRAWC